MDEEYLLHCEKLNVSLEHEKTSVNCTDSRRLTGLVSKLANNMHDGITGI